MVDEIQRESSPEGLSPKASNRKGREEIAKFAKKNSLDNWFHVHCGCFVNFAVKGSVVCGI